MATLTYLEWYGMSIWKSCTGNNVLCQRSLPLRDHKTIGSVLGTIHCPIWWHKHDL